MRYENGTGMFVSVEEEDLSIWHDEKIDGGGAVKEEKKERSMQDTY